MFSKLHLLQRSYICHPHSPLPFFSFWVYFKMSLITQPSSLATSLLSEHLVPHIHFFFCWDNLNTLANFPQVCVEPSILETRFYPQLIRHKAASSETFLVLGFLSTETWISQNTNVVGEGFLCMESCDITDGGKTWNNTINSLLFF